MAQEIIDALEMFQDADDGSQDSFFRFGLNSKIKLHSISVEENEKGSNYVKVTFSKGSNTRDFFLYFPDQSREKYDLAIKGLFGNVKHLVHVFDEEKTLDTKVIQFFKQKGIQPTPEAVIEKYIELFNKSVEYKNVELDLFLEYSSPSKKDGKQYLQIPMYPKWITKSVNVKGEWHEVRDPEKGLYYIDTEDANNIHPFRKSVKWMQSDRANRVVQGAEQDVEDPLIPEGAKKTSLDSILGSDDNSDDDTFLGGKLLE